MTRVVSCRRNQESEGERPGEPLPSRFLMLTHALDGTQSWANDGASVPIARTPTPSSLLLLLPPLPPLSLHILLMLIP